MPIKVLFSFVVFRNLSFFFEKQKQHTYSQTVFQSFSITMWKNVVDIYCSYFVVKLYFVEGCCYIMHMWLHSVTSWWTARNTQTMCSPCS